MITYRFQWLWVSVRSPSIWIVYLFIKTLLLLLPNSTDFAPETHHFGCSKYIPDHEPLNFCGTPAVYNVTPVASHLAARFMRGNNGEKQHNLSKWIIHIILHPLTWKLRLVWGSYPCYTIMEPMTSRREVVVIDPDALKNVAYLWGPIQLYGHPPQSQALIIP